MAKPEPAKEPAKESAGLQIDALVYSMASGDGFLYAGTSRGLYRSATDGAVWQPVAVPELPEVRFLSIQGSRMLAGGLKSMKLSKDNGATWKTIPMPSGLLQISALSVDDQGDVWAGGGEGLFELAANSETWTLFEKLHLTQVDAIFFDRHADRILITTADSPFVFAVHLPDSKVTYWNTGWKLRFARPVGDHLVGVTLYDGVVVQPVMVESKEQELSFTPAKSSVVQSSPAETPGEAKSGQP
jgi:hypothetical protein